MTRKYGEGKFYAYDTSLGSGGAEFLVCPQDESRQNAYDPTTRAPDRRPVGGEGGVIRVTE